MTIDGAIKSPYFSWRAGRETDVSAWLAEVAASGAPWADFESDKYMFTIPVSALSGVSNPDAIMQRWDQILDSFRIVSGRPLERQRPEYYIPDTRLVTPAYGAGYPLVITLPEFNRLQSDWNPLTVLTVPPSWILLHEMGHNAAHPTITPDASQGCDSQFEAESIVHINAVHIYNTLYGMSIDEAFAASAAQSLSLNEAAFDWILSTNFRTNQPMSFDLTAPIVDQDMLKYQHRSWAKYVDIAGHFGWSKLGEINGSFYTPGVPRVGSVCDSHPVFTDPDEYIRAASDALGVNAAPLFHFWGIIPSPSLAAELASRPKSQTIKAMIETYLQEVIPLDLASYMITHNSVYPRMGSQQPRYDQYITQFDETFVDEMFAQFELVLQTYGLVGPASPTGLQADVSGNSVTLNWTDNSSDEVEFIISAINPTETTYETVAIVPTNVTSHTLADLTPGTYRFRVTALNLEGLQSELFSAPAITVVIPTPYQSWISGFYPGINDPDVIGETADPNGDGIANIVAFVLGSDPTVFQENSLPVMSIDANYFVVQYRRADQASSVENVVQYSSNLNSWNTATHSIGGVLIVVEDDGIATGIDRVTVSIPHNGQNEMFARLRIN